MGWLKDQVTKLFNWLADKIIRPILKWLTEKIEWLIAEIKIAAINAVNKIAEWLGHDFVFLYALGWAIVAIKYAPQISAFLLNLKSKILSSALINAVKELASLIRLDQLLINIQLANSIFKLFWSEYREIMQPFSEALSGAAQMMGEGSGYLHSFLTLARSISINTAGLLGINAEGAEEEAYVRMSEWSKNLQNRLRRYVHNPGLMMTDFITEVAIPMAEENMELQGALVGDVRSAHDRLEAQHRAVQGISDAITQYVSELPEAIRLVVDARWIPFRDALQERLDFIENEVFSVIDETLIIFEKRAAYAEQIALTVEAKLDDPIAIIGTGFLYGDEYKQDYQDMFESLSGANLMQAGMLFGDISESYGKAADAIELEYYKKILDLPALQFEDQISVTGIIGKKADIPSPFVGDY